MRKQVVITGMGAVTPIGIGVTAYWESLLAGQSGVGPISLFDPQEYPCRIAAEVKGFDPERYFERKRARLMARSTQFGAAAALMCLEDGHWKAGSEQDRLGVIAGVSNSAQDAGEVAIDALREHGYRRTLPYVLTKCFPHATATETGLLTGFQSQVMTFSTACTAGMNALGYAVEEIRAGRSDVLLCTSTDSTIAKYVFAYFCRANMLSLNNRDPSHASRPFDAKRDGGILGEGAAGFLLEDLDHARRRGARVYAEILGFGTSGIGYSTNPEKDAPAGMAQAMRQALAAANCSPGQIDFIGAHGVSDPHLDVLETRAYKQVFGEYACRIPMSSVKSMIGIPQNAAGTLQLVATVMAIEHGILPPTANYEFPDPECDLDYIPNKPRRNQIRRALVLTHGFNGSDAAIVVGRVCAP